MLLKIIPKLIKSTSFITYIIEDSYGNPLIDDYSILYYEDDIYITRTCTIIILIIMYEINPDNKILSNPFTVIDMNDGISDTTDINI